MTKEIYLDHAATTPINGKVAKAMSSCLANIYGKRVSYPITTGSKVSDAIAFVFSLPTKSMKRLVTKKEKKRGAARIWR